MRVIIPARNPYPGRMVVLGILILYLVCGIHVAAQTSLLDLEVNSIGTLPWDVTNIKPGDSGTFTLTLHNNGVRNGCVHIWITNITEQDFGGDGAALDEYLVLGLTQSRLETNLSLPCGVRDFPHSYPEIASINITQLNAGEAITLEWTWEFRETGSPMNDAQGDSLSFDTMFILEELVSAAQYSGRSGSHTIAGAYMGTSDQETLPDDGVTAMGSEDPQGSEDSPGTHDVPGSETPPEKTDSSQESGIVITGQVILTILFAGVSASAIWMIFRSR